MERKKQGKKKSSATRSGYTVFLAGHCNSQLINLQMLEDILSEIPGFLLIDIPTKKWKGYGFIEMRDESSRQYLLSLGGIKIGEDILYFKEHKSGKSLEREKIDISKRKVFVQNPPRSWQQSNLLTFFSQYGEVEDCSFTIHPVKRELKFGALLFKDQKVANRLLELGKVYHREGDILLLAQRPNIEGWVENQFRFIKDPGAGFQVCKDGQELMEPYRDERKQKKQSRPDKNRRKQRDYVRQKQPKRRTYNPSSQGHEQQFYHPGPYPAQQDQRYARREDGGSLNQETYYNQYSYQNWGGQENMKERKSQRTQTLSKNQQNQISGLSDKTFKTDQKHRGDLLGRLGNEPFREQDEVQNPYSYSSSSEAQNSNRGNPSSQSSQWGRSSHDPVVRSVDRDLLADLRYGETQNQHQQHQIAGNNAPVEDKALPRHSTTYHKVSASSQQNQHIPTQSRAQKDIKQGEYPPGYSQEPQRAAGGGQSTNPAAGDERTTELARRRREGLPSPGNDLIIQDEAQITQPAQSYQNQSRMRKREVFTTFGSEFQLHKVRPTKSRYFDTQLTKMRFSSRVLEFERNYVLNEGSELGSQTANQQGSTPGIGMSQSEALQQYLYRKKKTPTYIGDDLDQPHEPNF